MMKETFTKADSWNITFPAIQIRYNDVFNKLADYIQLYILLETHIGLKLKSDARLCASVGRRGSTEFAEEWFSNKT